MRRRLPQDPGRDLVLTSAGPDLGGEGGQQRGTVRTRIEQAGKAGDRSEERLEPRQQHGRATAPAVVGPQRRIEPRPADPGPAAAVAQQMAPAVRPAPRHQVGAERDHAGAARDDRSRPLPQCPGVRGHRVGGQRHPPYAECLRQGVGQPGAQPDSQGRHSGRPDRRGDDCRPGVLLLQQAADSGQQLIEEVPGVDAVRARPYGFGADGGGRRTPRVHRTERHAQSRPPGVHPEDERVRHGSRPSDGPAPAWRVSGSNGHRSLRTTACGSSCADSEGMGDWRRAAPYRSTRPDGGLMITLHRVGR